MIWEVGKELIPLEKPEITRAQLKQYAAAALDHNPIHLEDSFAQASGFPGIIVHGMLSMAFLADYLALNFPKSEYRVERFKVRFRKVTFPGDRLTCFGEVKKTLEDGRFLVSVQAKNQSDEVTTEGEAEISPV